MTTDCRLLIVEDNAALRDLYAATFDACGFSVLVAGTAAEAMELAACHPIEAVLTDLDLPGLTGFELCRAIERQFGAVGYRIPIWVMSGTHHFDEADLPTVPGVCEILRKPFSISDVAGRIRAQIESADAVQFRSTRGGLMPLHEPHI